MRTNLIVRANLIGRANLFGCEMKSDEKEISPCNYFNFESVNTQLGS